MIKNYLQSSLLLVFLTITSFSQSQNHPLKREMRGVWIATVANIDWPATRSTNANQQREELREMLDQLEKLNINTIVFQARPTSDAFYYSAYEPWSAYFTGKQGRKPMPYFDPLEYLTKEAHKRCMDIHVWLNPYRLLNNEAIASLDKTHLYFQKPQLFLKYGGKYYFNPGLDETRAHLNQVVKDIVERYDIDAIHFDDYFYPYPVAGQEFPDHDTFRKYPRGFTNKADWRRNNVNMVIAELKQTIQSTKPWVEFGISPFGVWRNNTVDPKGSATRAGIQNYDDLYADILKWLEEGTIDYVAPQLYWEIGKKIADYEILLEWWTKHSFNKNVYIGLYASGLTLRNEAAWKKPNELARQIRMNRQNKQVDGAIFYSARPFLNNPQGLLDSLQTQLFTYKALQPFNRNLGRNKAIQPENIRLLKDNKEVVLTWDSVVAEGGDAIAYYVVYCFKGKKPGNLENPENILTLTTENMVRLNQLKKLKGYYTFVVTAVNRYKEESLPNYAVTRKL
ncbi:MAG: hypothetical protein BGP01_10495 [Paludibacter sp. 47-17]|nr:MAG: hypothetical protein BGP01_10495 [Paludibacter sp. 47-17]